MSAAASTTSSSPVQDGLPLLSPQRQQPQQLQERRVLKLGQASVPMVPLIVVLVVIGAISFASGRLSGSPQALPGPAIISLRAQGVPVTQHNQTATSLAAATPLPSQPANCDQHQVRASAAPGRPADSIKLFVGVLSRPARAEARQVVRETWGESHPSIGRLMFFTQRPKDADQFRRLRREATSLGDLVISSEIYEDYYNITYSVLEIFKTAARLDGITHVVKTDEDCYVRWSLLLPALAAMPRQWVYAGASMGYGSVLRQKGWHHVPYSNWASDKPVQYAFGWGYLTSIDLAREIAAGAAHMIMPGHNLLIIEDVAVAYWIEFVGKENNVTINYSRLTAGETCNAQDMFYHIKAGSKWELMRCMHKQGGKCC